MDTIDGMISVIVPVYKAEQFIHECIDSILQQTHHNLEILLVDDGSPDNCPNICDDYARLDSRIKVIHKENGGLSDARNAGIEVATGEYIAFIDSDDWIKEDMLEYLYRGLVGSDADISYCEVIRAKNDSYSYKVRNCDVIYSKEAALNELFFDRLENYACNKLFKASLWEDVRFPVGWNFEDIATIYKTFELSSRIAVLQEPKYFYRIRSDSISGSKDYEFRKNIYHAIISRYDDVAPRMPQYRPQLFRRVRNWYIHELCIQLRDNPDDYLTNIDLLKTLAPFVARVKDDIIEDLKLEKLEIKKLNAFSEGTIDGCKRSLRYHQALTRKNHLKKKLGNLFS